MGAARVVEWSVPRVRPPRAHGPHPGDANGKSWSRSETLLLFIFLELGLVYKFQVPAEASDVARFSGQ